MLMQSTVPISILFHLMISPFHLPTHPIHRHLSKYQQNFPSRIVLYHWWQMDSNMFRSEEKDTQKKFKTHTSIATWFFYTNFTPVQRHIRTFIVKWKQYIAQVWRVKKIYCKMKTVREGSKFWIYVCVGMWFFFYCL